MEKEPLSQLSGYESVQQVTKRSFDLFYYNDKSLGFLSGGLNFQEIDKFKHPQVMGSFWL